MKKFFGFLLLIIVATVFTSLLPAAQSPAAQQEDIFGGENVKAVIAGAEAGDVEAQMALAQRYRFGVGVTRDSARAVEWFQKAAEQGHAGSQINLADIYTKCKSYFTGGHIPIFSHWNNT